MRWFNRFFTKVPSVRFQCICFAIGIAGSINEGKAQELNQGSINDSTELSLEELVNIQVDFVVTASKYEQKVTQAPASVSIVTADDIRKLGYRSLADVFRGIRGFFVSNDRTYSYLGSRGFQRPGDFNTRFLLLINGHRMNDNIYTGSSVGTDGALDVDLIDRVEVIRGPSSSIYGNSAFLGVVNVITKTGLQLDGAEGSFEGGSFGTYKARLTFGKKWDNDIELLLSGLYWTSGGQDNLYYAEFDQRISSDPRARNNGVVLNADNERSHQFYAKATYRDFALSGLYSFRTKDVPTAPYGSFFGGEASSTDKRWYAEIQYNHRFDQLEILGRLSYDVFPHIGKYPYDYGGNNQPQDIVIDHDGTFGNWLTTEIQLKQRILDRHTAIVGAEYQENLTQHLFNYDGLGTTFVEDRRNSRNFAVYGQAEVVLSDALLMNAGLRFDHFETFGGTLNPRVGLIYNPWNETTFKLLYGQAFRAPNNYELYFGSPALGQVPNPDLQAETMRTYEIIYEQYLLTYFRFSASGYYYKIDKLITETIQPGSGFVIFGNVARVQAKGLEFELEGKYPGGLRTRASYALQQAQDAITKDDLTSSPHHLIKGNLIVPLYQENVFAGLELQYQSSIELLSGRRTDGFVVANLTLLSREIVKGLGASVSVYNVLNTRYGSPTSGGYLQDAIQQDGRSVRAKITYNY